MLEKNIHFYAPSHYTGKGHIKAAKVFSICNTSVSC